MDSPIIRSNSTSPPTAPAPIPTPVLRLFLHTECVDSVVGHTVVMIEEVAGANMDSVVEIAVTLLEDGKLVVEIDAAAAVGCEITNPLV